MSKLTEKLLAELGEAEIEHDMIRVELLSGHLARESYRESHPYPSFYCVRLCRAAATNYERAQRRRDNFEQLYILDRLEAALTLFKR